MNDAKPLSNDSKPTDETSDGDDLLARFPFYEEGKVPQYHRYHAEVSYLDELPLIWGKRWGAQGIGRLREVAMVRPTETEVRKLYEQDSAFFVFNGVTPDQVIGEARRGRRLIFTGDTAPCDMVRETAANADVLVHEATFLDEDRERAHETGHSTARQAAELAREAGVRLLALTHISTRYAGRQIREEAQQTFASTVVPSDGDWIDVPFPEKGPPEHHRPERQDRVPTTKTYSNS